MDFISSLCWMRLPAVTLDAAPPSAHPTASVKDQTYRGRQVATIAPWRQTIFHLSAALALLLIAGNSLMPAPSVKQMISFACLIHWIITTAVVSLARTFPWPTITITSDASPMLHVAPGSTFPVILVTSLVTILITCRMSVAVP